MFQMEANVHSQHLTIWVMTWLSGSTLVSISIVTPRRARLILGWVTICGQVNHLGITSHLGQLSLPSLLGRLIEHRSLSGCGYEGHIHQSRVAGNMCDLIWQVTCRSSDVFCLTFNMYCKTDKIK